MRLLATLSRSVRTALVPAALLSSFATLAQWAPQRMPSGLPNLTDIQFLDPDRGYAVAAIGGAVKTVDGGQTWTTLNTGIQSSLRDLWFVSPDTGYAVGNIAVVLRTTDGGRTWTHRDLSNTGQSVNGVWFRDADHGFVTQGDQIWQTSDGGLTWSPAYTYNGALAIFTFRYLKFPGGGLTGYAVGGFSGSFGNVAEVVKTTDGGQTWQIAYPASSSPSLGGVSALAFANPRVGYLADVQSRLFRTTNGGRSWTQMAQGTFGSFYAIAFTDSLTGFGVGDQGNLRMTTDGGQTWADQHLNQTDLYSAVCFPSPTVGYAGGARNNSADAGMVKFTTTPSGLPTALTDGGPAVYPNPARGVLRVTSLPTDSAPHLTLLDGLGRSCRQTTADALEVAGLPAGVYALRVEAAGRTWTRRVVVE